MDQENRDATICVTFTSSHRPAHPKHRRTASSNLFIAKLASHQDFFRVISKSDLSLQWQCMDEGIRTCGAIPKYTYLFQTLGLEMNFVS